MTKEDPIEGLEPMDIEPYVRKFGNVTVIGTNHTADLSRRAVTPKDYEVFSAFALSDHLLIEGSRLSHLPLMVGLNAGTRVMNYDLQALSFFQGAREQNIHPLEEGVDLVALGKQYGIDRLTSIGYLSSLYIKDAEAARQIANPISFGAFLATYADFFELICPSLSQMDDEGLEDIIGRQVVASLHASISTAEGDNHATSLNLKRLKGYGAVANYLGRVRDFEAIVPNTRCLLPELQGSKVIVIGKNHVPNIEKAIKGEDMTRPRPWAEHKGSLSQDKREEVEAFEFFARAGLHDNREHL